jgi:hypothetical protein
LGASPNRPCKKAGAPIATETTARSTSCLLPAIETGRHYFNRLPSYFSEVFIELNFVFSLLPMPFTTTMIAIGLGTRFGGDPALAGKLFGNQRRLLPSKTLPAKVSRKSSGTELRLTELQSSRFYGPLEAWKLDLCP